MYLIRFFSIFSIFVLLTSVNSISIAAPSYQNGLYFSIAGNYYSTASTEFTGSSIESDDENPGNWIIEIPKLLKESYGFSGQVGFKFKKWGAGLQYSQNFLKKDDILWVDTDPALLMAFYDINGKYYFIQQPAFTTYFIFGIGYSTLYGKELKQWEDGSIDSSTYTGLCYNLGLGMNFYINHHLFLLGDYVYRGLSYTEVNEATLDNCLSHPLHTFHLGLGYNL